MRRRYNMWGLGQEVGEEIEYQAALDSGAQLSPSELAIAARYGIKPKTTSTSIADALNNLTKVLPATATSTAKLIQAYKGATGANLSAAEIAALQQAEAERQAKTRNMLIIGGLALGGLALMLYMFKNR